MIHPWEELSRAPLITEPFTKVYRVTYRLPDGRETDRDIRMGKDVAVIVARTLDGRFVVNTEYRPGPHRVMQDLPGGMIEDDEDPQLAAERELLEETGYAGEFQLLGVHYFSAYSTGKKYIFLADGCRKVAEQNLDDTELIEAHLLTLEEFKAMLFGTSTNDVDAGLLALHRLGLL